MSRAESGLRRERTVLLAALLILSGLAWAVLVWQSRSPGLAEGMGFTMGMGAALFLAMWVAMMVAVMFPTAAPMILTFARISRDRQGSGQAFVPTWVFVVSYLLVWSLFGVIAYIAASAVDSVAERAAFLSQNGARIGGALLLAAGLYQLSPLKHACLSKCRTPMEFILTSWREGYRGAFQMGVHHGVYCLGCCWLLFVILFPLGVMNIAAVGLVTALIFAEKSLRHGVWLGRVVGFGLALWGLAVTLMPGLLLTSV